MIVHLDVRTQHLDVANLLTLTVGCGLDEVSESGVGLVVLRWAIVSTRRRENHNGLALGFVLTPDKVIEHSRQTGFEKRCLGDRAVVGFG